MGDLKKDIIDKFASDKLKNLSYLNEMEIALFSIMSALSDVDEYFKNVFEPLIKNYVEYKKSLKGFGITVIQNMLNPFRVYQVEESLETKKPVEKERKKWIFF